VCFITALERHLSATMILLMIGTLVIFIGGAPSSRSASRSVQAAVLSPF
jgi:hypothetical protein